MWKARIALGLFAAATIAFAVAGFVSSHRSKKLLAYLSAPLTPPEGVKRGDALRLEGVVLGENTRTSIYGQTRCVAFRSVLQWRLEYEDSEGDTETEYETFVDEKKGPEQLSLQVGEWKARLPLELWSSMRGGLEKDDIEKLPKHVSSSRKPSGGTLTGYAVHELAFAKGDRVFVAGTARAVDAEKKTLTVGVDPRLKEGVELVAGSHATLKAMIARQAKGQSIGGFVLVGVALVLLIPLVVMEIRHRRRRVTTHAPQG